MTADLGLLLVLAGGVLFFTASARYYRKGARDWSPAGLALQLAGDLLSRFWVLAGITTGLLLTVPVIWHLRRRVRDAAARRALAEAQALSRIEQMRRNARWS